MKNALKYLALWQKKRGEWPVDDDPQSDWLQMQPLLDQHMPLAGTQIGGKPSGIKALSLWAKLGLVLSAVVVIYSAYYLLSTKANKRPHVNKFHKENAVKQDANVQHASSLTDLNTDSQNQLSTKQQLPAQVNDTNVGAQPGLKRLLSTQNGKVLNPLTNGQSGSASIQSSTGGNLPAFNGSRISSHSSSNKKPARLNSRSARALEAGLLGNTQKHNGNALSSSSEKNSRPGNNARGHYPGVDYRVKQAKFNNPAGSDAAYAVNHHKRSSNNNLLLLHINGSGLSNTNATSAATDSGRPENGTGNKTAQAISGLNTNDKNGSNASRERYSDLVAVNLGLGSIGKNFKIISSPVVKYKIIKGGAGGKSQIAVNKKSKEGNIKSSSLNWGILIGANSSGSFTPKSQNANFYGNSPVDLFFGPFVTYNFSGKWAVNTQLRLLNPQAIVTTYFHSNGSKVDSGQSLTITSSRKMYSVSIPLYAVYKLTPNISFKLGPVINIPTKQINVSSALQPYSIRTDSTYYKKISGELDSTSYQQRVNYGLSGGVSIRVKRFIFEATYLKSLSGYQVTSGLGSYKSKNGTFQFTVGFQFK